MPTAGFGTVWELFETKNLESSTSKQQILDRIIFCIWLPFIVTLLSTGYEINGLENLPSDRPALIIYYHGAIPIDIYYFIAKTLILKNRLIHTVADNFLFNIPGLLKMLTKRSNFILVNLFPGWPIIAEALKVVPGTVQQCANILTDNNMLAIAPGGVYEAQFGDSYYEILWRKRMGFAKVALEAKVVGP